MRKCSSAVVINSGSAEHSLTGNRRVLILAHVVASAGSYKNLVIHDIFQQKSKQNDNPKRSNLTLSNHKR